MATDRGQGESPATVDPRSTPQVPPNPIVTVPSSTMTGTARRPLLNSSMRCNSAGFFLTLM
jgi:hypothetical protein